MHQGPPVCHVQGLQFSRLLWSAFLHADEMHLFYNMSLPAVEGAPCYALLCPALLLSL